MNTTKWFLKNREWYRSRGINYKLGIMLYGPPGTGKSSIARAIASELDYNLKIFTSSVSTEDMPSLLTKTQDSIILMEDIDCFSFTHSRDDEKQSENENGLSQAIKNLDTAKFSGFLNTLDGSLTPEGIIFIATTNHIEKLDSALLRKGRFDLVLEVGYLNDELQKEMIRYLFQKDDLDLSMFKSGLNITGSQIQGAFFESEGNITKFFELLYGENT